MQQEPLTSDHALGVLQAGRGSFAGRGWVLYT